MDHISLEFEITSLTKGTARERTRQRRGGGRREGGKMRGGVMRGAPGVGIKEEELASL